MKNSLKRLNCNNFGQNSVMLQLKQQHHCELPFRLFTIKNIAKDDGLIVTYRTVFLNNFGELAIKILVETAV